MDTTTRERMTGGTAIVRSLIAQSTDTLFRMPGVQLDGLFNALYDHRNQLRTINARHEQGVAYMAYGYAYSTGRPGVFAVVPGPGILNAAAGLPTAYGSNQPVLAITGQIPSATIGRGLGILHEIPDQLGMMRGLSKWAERIEHPTTAPGLVNEAFRQLRTGRPRPAALEMAMDMLALESEVAMPGHIGPEAAAEPDSDLIAKAAKLLGQAKTPLICVGGGAFEAAPEILALAEMLQAPVTAFQHGRGIVDDRVIATDLHNPDFVKLAESFGATGYRVDTPDALRDCITRALGEPGPTLIEVPVGEFPEPWPIFRPGPWKP